MTDKQMIIDGVDVSGCVHFIQEEKDCCDLGGNCKGWTNCYYKQLKRSEAQCEGMFVTHTDLEMKYKAKEQECERLKQKLHQCWNVENSFVEQIEQLEGVIKKYEECNKYLVEENGKTYTRLEYKLLKTLAEIKPVLEIYSNSKIGEILDDGRSMACLWSKDSFGFPIPDCSHVYIYDPNPAKEALQKIKEVE